MWRFFGLASRRGAGAGRGRLPRREPRHAVVVGQELHHVLGPLAGELPPLLALGVAVHALVQPPDQLRVLLAELLELLPVQFTAVAGLLSRSGPGRARWAGCS